MKALHYLCTLFDSLRLFCGDIDKIGSSVISRPIHRTLWPIDNAAHLHGLTLPFSAVGLTFVYLHHLSQAKQPIWPVKSFETHQFRSTTAGSFLHRTDSSNSHAYTEHRFEPRSTATSTENIKMSRTAEPMPRSPFLGDPNYHAQRHVPILPSSTTSTTFSQSDIMDMTPPASAAMGPPSNSSPEMETDGHNIGLSGEAGPSANGNNGGILSAAAAATSQQPKVVQTAFIHKLYKYGFHVWL